MIFYFFLHNFEENKLYKMNKLPKFLTIYYPIILAFICLLYSVTLGLLGYTDEAQYSAHWPGTILLFAIAIRQRRSDLNKKSRRR